MPAIGSLRVELELADGSFTTRVVRAQTSLRQLEAQVGGTVTAVRRLEDGFGDLTGGATRLVLSLALAREAVQTLYTVFGSWVVNIVNVNREIERLTVLMRGLSSATDFADRVSEANKNIRDLLEFAKRAPYDLQTLSNTFVKLRSAGIEPMAGSMQALVDAVANFGGTKEQLDRASIAIQQMSGKGVISMEELRQQLGEAVPRAVELMARSVGMGISEFVTEVSNGRVRAAPALEAFRLELSRTFGGAALDLMDTLQGRLQQLSLAWQEFSLKTGGEPGSGGFFDAVKDAVKALSDGLRSGEAQAFAASLNRTLADLTRSLMSTAEWIVRWRDEISTAIRVLGGLLILRVSTSLMMSFAAAIGFVGLAISTLPAKLAAAAGAMTAFTAATRANTIATWGQQLGFALAAIGTRLTAAIAGMSALGLAFAGLSGIGAVVVVLGLVGAALDLLGLRATRAGEALQSLRDGSTDKKNLDAVREEIGAITRDVEKLEAALKATREERERVANGGRFPSVPGVNGLEFSQLSITGGGGLTARNRLVQSEESITSALINLREQRAARLAAIDAAIATQAQNRANLFAEGQIATLRDRLRQLKQVQDAEGKRIQEARGALVGADQAQDSDARLALNARDRDRIKTYYDSVIGIYDTFIRERAERLIAIQRQSNPDQQEIRNLETLLERARELRQEQENERKATEAAAQNNPISRAEAEFNRALREATTMQAGMEQRLGSLRGQFEETGSEYERLLAKLAAPVAPNSDSTWATLLPPDLIERLKALSKEVVEAKEKARQFQERIQAIGNIDTGLARAQTELRGYIDRLNDPNLPDAQQRFLEFQRQMAAELDKVRISTNGVGAAFASAAGAAAAAVQSASLNSLLSQVERLSGEGERGRIAALPPGPARAEEERRQKRAEIAALRSSLMAQRDAFEEGTQQRDAALAGLRRLQDAEGGVLAGIAGRADRAGGGGAAQANQLANYTGRIAELREEMFNLGGEAAKVRARLTELGTVDTDYGRGLVERATEVDRLTKALETVRRGYQALDEVQRQSREEGARGDEYAAMLANPDQSEASRRIINIRARIAEAANRVRQAISTQQTEGGRVDPKLVEQLRDLEDPNGATARANRVLALQQSLEQRRSSRELQASLAETLTQRREIARQTLEIETNQQRDIINTSKLSDEERRNALDALVEYSRLRNEQIARDTEGPMFRLARQWKDVAANMEGAVANFVDKAIDGFAELLVKGKADFKSLADSLIMEIVRIQLKAAAAALLGGGKDGGAGGLLSGLVTGVIGAFLGGGKPAAGLGGGYDKFDIGPAKTFHAGGIVGLEGRYRQVPSALFSRAPRFHMGADEVPAILQKGEAVFSRGQLALLGNSMSKIADYMGPPRGAMPMQPDMNMNRNSGPPVTLNLINETGQKADAMAGTPRFDGEQMILDVVIKRAREPGAFRDGLRGALG